MKTQGETEKCTHTQTHTRTQRSFIHSPLSAADRSARETGMERKEIEADRRCSRKRQPVQVTHKELEKTSKKINRNLFTVFSKVFNFVRK